MGEHTLTERVIVWHRQHGRHSLPWQQPRTPWRVWVSEIMLQQTQVATVIPYFERFVQRFPNPVSLAQADENELLQYWQGLGYYSRARNLHHASRQVTAGHGGEVPDTFPALLNLKGIGPSTAGAILSLGFDRPGVVLDGNVKRVLCRHAGIREWPGLREVEKRLWEHAALYASESNPAAWSQGIMDLGATLCTPAKPQCERCPLAEDCQSRQQNLQEQIPARRPGRATPLRHAYLLWLQRSDDGAVWLVKRPPRGIWGGLWCLPQSDYDQDYAAAVGTLAGSDNLPVASDQLEPLQQCGAFKHTFTHFRLQATVLFRSVDTSETLAQTLSPNQKAGWFRLQEPLPALPTPLARLLAQPGIVEARSLFPEPQP